MKMMEQFKYTLIVMAFFSFIITVYSYAMPDEMRKYINSFDDLVDDGEIAGISSSVEDSLTRQTSIPVIDVGALVFYSGNIFLDLLLNFVYAIPQMITLLFNGLMLMFGIDTNFMSLIQVFLSVLITILYFLGLIEMIIGVRSGRVA